MVPALMLDDVSQYAVVEALAPWFCYECAKTIYLDLVLIENSISPIDNF